jgi:hypothetical protein
MIAGAFMSVAPVERNRLDLDHCFWRIERGNLDDAVCGIGRGEPLAAQLYDLCEVFHGAQEDRDLDDFVEPRTGGLQGAIEIAESLLGLAIEVALADDLAIVTDRRLTRNEDEAVALIACESRNGA